MRTMLIEIYVGFCVCVCVLHNVAQQVNQYFLNGWCILQKQKKVGKNVYKELEGHRVLIIRI